MGQDVRAYFRKCTIAGDGRTVQIGTQLARGGVGDMDVLCRLLAQETEKLLALRGIGPKSLKIIQAVCAHYQSE